MNSKQDKIQSYFGTDGIRGRANIPPMTAQTAMQVAMATALVLRDVQNGDHTNRVIIGKDTRLSCYMLEQAMAAGFLSMGMNVVLLGPLPTPGVAMLTRSLRADLGVMISASHNPYEDNGIKLFGADGFKLDDEIQNRIEEKIPTDMSAFLAEPSALGKASRLDSEGRYIESVKGSFARSRTLEGLKVVVDCAHGAAYKVAPQALWEMEAEVISIGVSPNGRNINDNYGATATKSLQNAVVLHNADIGLALDGDGDRLIVVDELGQVVDGDQIMGALAIWMKEKKHLNKNALVTTVMSNLGLERVLKEHDIDLIRTQVGDRYVVEKMREGGYNIGGEQSGHLVLSDFSTTGDGLLAGLHVLNLVKARGLPASQTLNVFTPVPQLLKNVRYKGSSPLDNADVSKKIEEISGQITGKGRVLVRPSGTEPLIRVMVEGDDADMIESTANALCDVIERAA